LTFSSLLAIILPVSRKINRFAIAGRPRLY
jgi:hypothetical protein